MSEFLTAFLGLFVWIKATNDKDLEKLEKTGNALLGGVAGGFVSAINKLGQMSDNSSASSNKNSNNDKPPV